MKILKNKTFEGLMLELANNQGLISSQNDKILELTDKQKDNALSLRIRRAIIGKKASGKTTFIRKVLVREITNYFLIDAFGEYTEIPKENKIVLNTKLSLEKQSEEIKNAIKKNRDKIIIFDNASHCGTIYKTLFDFREKFNYIVVFQCKKNVDVNNFNVVYDFGTIDTKRNNGDYLFESGIRIDMTNAR